MGSIPEDVTLLAPMLKEKLQAVSPPEKPDSRFVLREVEKSYPHGTGYFYTEKGLSQEPLIEFLKNKYGVSWEGEFTVRRDVDYPHVDKVDVSW